MAARLSECNTEWQCGPCTPTRTHGISRALAQCTAITELRRKPAQPIRRWKYTHTTGTHGSILCARNQRSQGRQPAAILHLRTIERQCCDTSILFVQHACIAFPFPPTPPSPSPSPAAGAMHRTVLSMQKGDADFVLHWVSGEAFARDRLAASADAGTIYRGDIIERRGQCQRGCFGHVPCTGSRVGRLKGEEERDAAGSRHVLILS